MHIIDEKQIEQISYRVFIFIFAPCFSKHNSMIKITLPDSSVREFEPGVLGIDIAESISSRLAKKF